MHRASRLFVISLLALVLGSRPALAAPSPAAKQEAAERFERGVQLFKEQAYRAAVIEFQRAHDLVPDYRLLYNLAHAKHQLQDYLGAARDYEAYLARGGDEIPSERRAHVEQLLAALESRVGRIEVKVDRPGAEVYLDDAKVGVAPLPSLLLANVGRHRIAARAADGALASEYVDVAGGDIAQVALRLGPAAGPRVAQTSATPAAKPRSTKKQVALVGMALGGAALAASVATGVLSLRARDRLHDQVGTLGVDQAQVGTQRDKVERLSLGTDVLIGVGAALSVTGVVLWLVSASAERREERRASGVEVGVGLGALSLSGRF